MERGLPDTSGADAVEGTNAHYVAAISLETGRDPVNHVGQEMVDDAGNPFTLTRDMAEYVQAYVDHVRAIPGELMVEQRLSISHITGEPDAFATSDAVIIDPPLLTIIDLKYGVGVKVDAEENEQLLIYAEAARHQFAVLGDIETIRMVIHQPRLDHVSVWELPIDEFNARIESLKASAAMALECLEYDREFVESQLVAGDKQCRFCKAKATCPELIRVVNETTAGDFDNLDGKVAIRSHDPEVLSNAMQRVDLIEQWCKAVRAAVESELLAGRAVPGFKLVQGKRGARKWIDEADVTAAMIDMNVRRDVMFETSLISPTTAEKLLKADPDKWSRLTELITQSAGNPSVAPVGDKRPALEIKPVADDFSQI
jgi:antitoxin component of MazEF toxin-antitoxin module